MELPSSIKHALEAVTPSERSRLWKRIKTRFRRSFNEGAAPFLIGIVLLAFSFITLRIYQVQNEQFRGRTQREIESIIGSEFEPTDANRSLGLISAVLGSINRDFDVSDWPCAPVDLDCEAAEAIHVLFDKMLARVKLFDVAEKDTESFYYLELSSLLDGVDLSSHLSKKDRSEWIDLAEKAFRKINRQLETPSCVCICKCGDLGQDSPPRIREIGPPGCIRRTPDTYTSLIVPSQHNDFFESNELQGTLKCSDASEELEVEACSTATPIYRGNIFDSNPCRQMRAYKKPIQQSILLSEILDIIISLIHKPSLQPRAKPDEKSIGPLRDNIAFSKSDVSAAEYSPSLVQAYFISPQSVIRIWTKRAADPATEFPGTRLWAGQHYFEVFWDSEIPFYQSPAYIDFGGHGVVTTHCTPIDWPQVKGSSARDLVGILCTDMQLPRLALTRKLQDNPLLDAVFVTFPLSQPINRESIEVEFLSLPGGSVLEGAIQAAIKETIENQSNLNDLRRIVVEVGQFGNFGKSFLLPLGAAENDALNALLVIPRPPEAPLIVNLSGFLCIVFFSLTAASLVWGFHLKRRQAQLAHRHALIRNLPVGVVKVDSQDRIREANDHAEELLGRELPKLDTDGPPVEFGRLIEPTVLDEEDGEVLYESIAEKRKKGLSSTYYARLRPCNGQPSGPWIRVTGTPFLWVGGAKSGLGWKLKTEDTFGVLSRVPKGFDPVKAIIRKKKSE